MQIAIVKRITWGAKPRGGRQPYRWQVVIWNVDAYGPTTIAEVATHKSEREANNDRRARSV